MYRYRPVEMWSTDWNRITYGILAEERCDDFWRSIAIVPDVSCDKAFVERLTVKCTKGQLSPTHLLDVIIDALLL